MKYVPGAPPSWEMQDDGSYKGKMTEWQLERERMQRLGLITSRLLNLDLSRKQAKRLEQEKAELERLLKLSERGAPYSSGNGGEGEANGGGYGAEAQFVVAEGNDPLS